MNLSNACEHILSFGDMSVPRRCFN